MTHAGSDRFFLSRALNLARKFPVETLDVLGLRQNTQSLSETGTASSMA